MRSRWFTAFAVGVMAAAVGTGPAPAATTPSGATPKPGTTPPPMASSARVSAEEAYWTAGRMAAAVPVDEARGRGTAGGPPGPRDRTLSPAPSGTPAGTYFDGMPMVGTFFYQGSEQGSKVGNAATSCTGSVVRSAGRNMVLTAAHCAKDMAEPRNHAVFVPQYRHGRAAGAQPFGIFRVKADGVYTDPRYASNSKAAVSDLDVAFALVEPNARGSVENVTGALTFTPGSTYEHDVTVVGYPSSSSVNPKHKAIRCDVPTTRLGGFRQMQMRCKGFYGGVSGGPWIKDYDAAGRTGKVVGNTGGYHGGGNDSWVTYAPVYGKDAQDLYDDADAGRDPGSISRPPYRGSADSPLLPGLGDLWTHARQIASGDFTGSGRSSLLVVWTDGEVTLFPGDGKGGFLPERRLAAPNAGWKPVATVTAGDFTGSRQFDLMVRWSDGRMTLHEDVGSHGLGSVTEMAPSGSVWKYATQIAAGRFAAATYVTDLMVRWSDGELSLYTQVGARTFGREHQLKDPNDTWKGATLLTSGQFSGNQKWDLMVRWSTGALDTYAGTTPAGLGSAQTVHGPSSTWTHSVIMTTGQYAGDGLTNDLVVRWSDGETTLYEDTRTHRLGTERMLVPPRV
ncbi:trypsin-like serine protease [Streptomyces sp. NPDC006450]|uniref:trypsin-like serine peptidase n=1 Tax=Streptomyces sp. NPDC006450 TaxID=3155458 RepID=UPI0033B62AB3